MKNFYNKYLNDEIKVDNSTFISLLCGSPNNLGV